MAAHTMDIKKSPVDEVSVVIVMWSLSARLLYYGIFVHRIFRIAIMLWSTASEVLLQIPGNRGAILRSDLKRF